ncbi:unnamed protein product [Microthlaspi erraticum]|uniref:Extensin domain-containing protein n=1 Tax=Microthlaspi erraticum TaxID=1685480 RepID=A0A6D2KTP1_9BRAS|nr:unnamed protein product [Microthlaspi erraticum]
MTSPKLLVIMLFSFMALFITSHATSFSPAGRKLFQHQYSHTPELPFSYSQSRLSFSKSPMPRRSLFLFRLGRFLRKKKPGKGSGPTPDLSPPYSATPKLPPPSYDRSSKVPPPPYNPTSEFQSWYTPTQELPPSYTPSTELPPSYTPAPAPSYSAAPSPAPYYY